MLELLLNGGWTQRMIRGYTVNLHSQDRESWVLTGPGIDIENNDPAVAIDFSFDYWKVDSDCPKEFNKDRRITSQRTMSFMRFWII